MAAEAAASFNRPAAGGPPAAAAATGTKPRGLTYGRIDEYEMLEKLGEGAYSEVRKARHRRTGEMVAIKSFFPGASESEVIREAFCQGVCSGDPAIVALKDIAEDARTGEKFIVMELVAGDTLGGIIWWTGMTEETARPVMQRLVGAAKKMHDAGIVHRDLKPENVLYDTSGGLKVCDFGSATVVKPAGEPYEDDGSVGTAIYNAPELIRSSRHHGAAVDMWALGCIMYELLTGGPLLVVDGDLGEQVSDIRDKIADHSSSVFEDLEELSEAGRDFLLGLLAFNPDERLTAAAALEHRWFVEPKPAADC